MTRVKNLFQNKQIVDVFKARRRALGMSYVDLARLSHVSLSTVNRFFKGNYPKISLDAVLRMADVLGIAMMPTQINTVYDAKARQSAQIAEQIVAQVSAASALEAQNISVKDRNDLTKEIAARLLTGSPRHLWTSTVEDSS